jgi:hypothetical protein
METRAKLWRELSHGTSHARVILLCVRPWLPPNFIDGAGFAGMQPFEIEV